MRVIRQAQCYTPAVYPKYQPCAYHDSSRTRKPLANDLLLHLKEASTSNNSIMKLITPLGFPSPHLAHNHATLLEGCGHPLLPLDLAIAKDDGVRYATWKSAWVRMASHRRR